MIRKCDLHWRIRRQDYLLKTPWLVVRRDAVSTPKGIEIDDFYVLEYPTWVNIIAKTIDHKYIVEQQYRHGIQQTVFELCAGTCEDGEDPLEAAKRELLEETGYAGGNWSMLSKVAPNPNSMNNWCFTFFADGVNKQKDPDPEPSEDILVHEVSEHDLFELMESGLIVEVSMLAALWKFFYNHKYNK